MIDHDLKQKIDAALEEAIKRSTMQAVILLPGDSVAGTYKGRTIYPNRQYNKTSMVLEKEDGSYVTYPINDFVNSQLEAQDAVVDRSIVTIYNNGIVETASGYKYNNLVVVVTPIDWSADYFI